MHLLRCSCRRARPQLRCWWAGGRATVPAQRGDGWHPCNPPPPSGALASALSSAAVGHAGSYLEAGTGLSIQSRTCRARGWGAWGGIRGGLIASAPVDAAGDPGCQRLPCTDAGTATAAALWPVAPGRQRAAVVRRSPHLADGRHVDVVVAQRIVQELVDLVNVGWLQRERRVDDRGRQASTPGRKPRLPLRSAGPKDDGRSCAALRGKL